MRLKVVVLPAPLGPMMPTISHSSRAMLTSRAACTPPKRMDRLRASSTDIGDLHLLRPPVLQVEAATAQPPLDRSDLLADPTREPGEGQEQQDRTDDERGQLLREVAGRRDVGQQPLQPPELVDEVPQQREEGGADDDAGPAPQAADH